MPVDLKSCRRRPPYPAQPPTQADPTRRRSVLVGYVVVPRFLLSVQTLSLIVVAPVRLKLAFCTTCAFRVLVLAQGPSFLGLRRALLRRRGGSQDKRSATLTLEGVETIQKKCSTSTEENEVVWKW